MEYPGKPRQSTMQQLGPYLGLGFQLVAATVAFGALGYWLDGRFGTSPWMLVIGLVLGAAGGMISFIRTALKAGKSGTKQQG